MKIQTQADYKNMLFEVITFLVIFIPHTHVCTHEKPSNGYHGTNWESAYVYSQTQPENILSWNI